MRTPAVARPLAASGGCRALEVWGHLQPDTGTRVVVAVQFAAKPGAYETVATLASGPDGVLDTVLRYSGPEPARVRLQFSYDNGTILSPAAEPAALGDQARPAGVPADVSCTGS
jgi:hypothetical protein